MNHYLYLLVDLGCLLIPFLFSFHPKIQFQKEWKCFFPANVLVGILFLIWDEYFTEMGVWGFNPDYLLGYYVGELPLEEILFFFCIPYACTFTYFVLQKYTLSLFSPTSAQYFIIAYGFLALVLFIIGFPAWYTSMTMVWVLLFLPILHLYSHRHLPYLFTMYVLITFPFLLSNGILTGSFIKEPIVWYNNAENLNFRVFTIPIEDFFYGFLLLSLNIFCYETCKKHALST